MKDLKNFRYSIGAYWIYPIAFGIGILIGFKVIPGNVVGIIYLAMAALLVYKAATTDTYGFFTYLPFMVFTEIFARAFLLWLPYLTMQYLYIICFALLLITGPKNKKAHFGGYILMVLFCSFELINNVHPDKPQIARSILTNSFALLAAVVWGAFNVLSPVLINKILYNIKIAGVYLAGIVFVAHLQGKIDYNSASSSEASNGMAPVQLSGYLGTVCVLFFLSIMNKGESKFKILNLVFLGLTAMVMILTFSRGGLYFIAATVCLFILYNIKRINEYAKFIFLLPVALIIYSLVVKETDGKIVERYEQKGSSSRDILVAIGFNIFLRHPFSGVGTSNYNTTIVKENLFYEKSGAHNEFVRAAAEHGIIGIIFHWGFFIALFFNIRSRGQPQQQFAMYFFVLFCLITVHNGLKISLQPIILMLAIAIQTLPYRTDPYSEHSEHAAATPAESSALPHAMLS